MQLSIIIVNYNVKYFLEQCLYAVHKAMNGLQAEVIVIDNNSKDGSIEYLEPLFGWVKFISNNKNEGFGKANNIALKEAKGEYVLFLNPDTILPENCLQNCIAFFESHADCGAVGVRMVDGSGQFLPESKRSFPSPLTSLFKLSGLSLVFPKSKFFNQYSLGYLNENENYSVDVLAGAFMMLKRAAIECTGGFDEAFFMYGEDVDLSYRVQQAGFKNYYLGTNTIVHFKGESTKRGSLNYVKMFYQAMSVFVNKHYGGNKAKVFSSLIKMAIWFRAFISFIQYVFKKIGLPLVDAMTVFLSMLAVEKFWALVVRDTPFLHNIVVYAIPGFTFVFLAGAMLSGIYDNLYKPSKALLASFSAIIFVLAVYSLLPENLRFSRAVILLGGILSGLMVTLVRWLMIETKMLPQNDESKKIQKTLIAGSEEEFQHILLLFEKLGWQNRILGRINIEKGTDEDTLGNIYQLASIKKNIDFKEVIFCAGKLSYQSILSAIQSNPVKIIYRFHRTKSASIVSSDSKFTTGETLTDEGFYTLSLSYQKRMKRMVDIWIALCLLVTYPILFSRYKSSKKALYHIFLVISGKRTWIGYSSFQNQLPLIPVGILNAQGQPNASPSHISKNILKKIDILYAKDYDWLIDFKTVIRHYRLIGN